MGPRSVSTFKAESTYHWAHAVPWSIGRTSDMQPKSVQGSVRTPWVNLRSAPTVRFQCLLHFLPETGSQRDLRREAAQSIHLWLQFEGTDKQWHQGGPRR